nr:N-myc-interactor [Loxodonta africana]
MTDHMEDQCSPGNSRHYGLRYASKTILDLRVQPGFDLNAATRSAAQSPDGAHRTIQNANVSCLGPILYIPLPFDDQARLSTSKFMTLWVRQHPLHDGQLRLHETKLLIRVTPRPEWPLRSPGTRLHKAASASGSPGRFLRSAFGLWPEEGALPRAQPHVVSRKGWRAGPRARPGRRVPALCWPTWGIMAANKDKIQYMLDFCEALKKDGEYKNLTDEITKQNIRLQEEIQKLETELKVNTRNIRNFQIKEDVPETKIKFISMENPENDSQFLNVSCSFQVNLQVPYELQKGQALITFEKEEVAQNVIRMRKHHVQIEDKDVEVTAQPVPLNSGVRFQVHVQVSKVKINVTGIPADGRLPADQMKDKLELSFSKSRNGGGEVECVEYDNQSQSAVITFVEIGVADRILKKKDYPLYVNQNCHRVTVSPYVVTHLEKLQVFSGISTRTVLLTGMEDIQMDEETVTDLVNIHFQRKKNGGGEVDVVTCSLSQPKIAYFEEET